MNYLNFNEWRGRHSTEMKKLTFANPQDIFIFTRFKGQGTCDFESKQLLFAQTVSEALGYIRHIFLYDIMNDIADDIEFDIENFMGERQNDMLSIIALWYILGKVSSCDEMKKTLEFFCKKFNKKFNNRKTNEYEICVLYGVEQLQDFIIKKFSNSENFDKEKFKAICSKELFAGKPLEDFITDFFNN